MKKIFVNSAALFVIMTMLTGCTFVFQKGRRTDTETIQKLQSDMDRLHDDYAQRLSDYENQIGQLEDELSDLERAKRDLENRLKNEIADDQVKVEMNDRGLVITFLAEVLFDSGKADLRDDAGAKLDKVGEVLKTIENMYIGVEGHTDNVPITHSKWKDNWELSAHRALTVLNHMADQQGLPPQRLSATGYGEYRPVASNDTKEGRSENRRVEIVIVPPVIKQSADAVNTKKPVKTKTQAPKANLK